MKVSSIIEIARAAGAAILTVYNDPQLADVVDYKADNSPLTLADQQANDVIIAGLEAAGNELPILSEEMKHAPYAERRHWPEFWLIDPLDGTKEFINRNGEFTVNIALIREGRPVAGVIYVPVHDILYYGDQSEAFKITQGKQRPIRVRNAQTNRIAVRSKSHASPEEDDVFRRYHTLDSISVGSSLKFCMVAEGKADVYYRHGPTMEWDTGAGQAIVEAAGGRVFAGSTEEKLFRYNKEELLNSSFLCLGF
jgi:3'(2'), 5'-bisphosphate nucleotidase